MSYLGRRRGMMVRYHPPGTAKPSALAKFKAELRMAGRWLPSPQALRLWQEYCERQERERQERAKAEQGGEGAGGQQQEEEEEAACSNRQEAAGAHQARERMRAGRVEGQPGEADELAALERSIWALNLELEAASSSSQQPGDAWRAGGGGGAGPQRFSVSTASGLEEHFYDCDHGEEEFDPAVALADSPLSDETDEAAKFQQYLRLQRQLQAQEDAEQEHAGRTSARRQQHSGVQGSRRVDHAGRQGRAAPPLSPSRAQHRSSASSSGRSSSSGGSSVGEASQQRPYPHVVYLSDEEEDNDQAVEEAVHALFLHFQEFDFAQLETKLSANLSKLLARVLGIARERGFLLLPRLHGQSLRMMLIHSTNELIHDLERRLKSWGWPEAADLQVLPPSAEGLLARLQARPLAVLEATSNSEIAARLRCVAQAAAQPLLQNLSAGLAVLQVPEEKNISLPLQLVVYPFLEHDPPKLFDLSVAAPRQQTKRLAQLLRRQQEEEEEEAREREVEAAMAQAARLVDVPD